MISSKVTGPGIVALVILALGFCVVAATTQTSVPPAYARVGPTVFPYAVGGALIVLGALLFGDARRQTWECEATDPQAPRPDPIPMAWMLGGLFANLLLIEHLGFIISSTAMYLLVARGFGAKRLWLAGIVGFVLALIAYFGFAQVLGLRMGDGLIEDLI